MDFNGLTGRIHYDNGKRTDFQLDVVELTLDGVKKVCNAWEPTLAIIQINTFFSHKITKNL